MLAERLAVVLDAGDGDVRPELRAFYEAVCAMPRPRRGLVWLAKPHVPPILRALALDQVPLTHEGLDTLRPWRAVAYLREQLISCGVLPEADRFLQFFQRWLPQWLDSIAPQHRRLLERFATWHVLRRLREASATAPVTPGLVNTARHHLRIADELLDHLKRHGRELKSCGQSDLDLWFAHDRGTRQGSRVFLRWCIQQREMPRLRLPPVFMPEKNALSQEQRLLHLRHALTDETMPAVDRVLALLVLLFAQPLHRIARLTLDDLIHDDDQVMLRLGNPPTPVPTPFAEILTTYLGARLVPAANPDSRFLFPGRHAGQPMHTTSLRLRLRNVGLPNEAARVAALRELVRQAPPAVVATMFGYHPTTAETLAAGAGTTWQRYAGGDHSRQP